MDYNKILEELAKNVNFNKYDAFSTEKKCHYITYKNKEYALIWQKVKVDDMDKYLDNLKKLKEKIDLAKNGGARLPAILAIHQRDNHVFQLQEKVNGKKFGNIELLDEKTTVEDFIELLITFDEMNFHGLTVDSGKNCFVDEEGHINIFDCILAKDEDPKLQIRYNARPELFKRLVFPEPYNYTEEEVEVLKRILEKWIMACARYFSNANMDREVLFDEIELTIKNYSFISLEEKRALINDVLDRTLQKRK